ncbi:MAG: serine hydrolase, partial [Chloroflexota bacterium]
PSLMLLRHGSVVAEGWWSPYRPERPHMLFSLSKSFTSSAVGLAVSEKRLSLDDKVISFFPNEAPAEVSEYLAALRVRDLLSMSSGQEQDALPALSRTKTGNWVEGFFSEPVVFEPGTHFVYNSGATYMLSAILQNVTGMTLLDYLQPRLMQPLGIEGATWEVSPQGINTGGWGLSVKTEDIARFMQVYLQKGIWNGQQILPQAWVEEATSRKISNGDDPNNDWTQGYAYQFWRCRHDAYRGDGAFGQFGIVMQAQDTVLAITSGVEDMQSVLNLVWEILLPGLGDAPLPEDPAAHAALSEKLASLALLPVKGQATSPIAAGISGRSYTFDANPIGLQTLVLDFSGAQTTATIQGLIGEQQIAIGYGEWREGEFPLPPPIGLVRYAVSGAWTTDDTCTLLLRLYETPFYVTIVCQFSDAQVDIDAKVNVFFEPIRYQLIGRMR